MDKNLRKLVNSSKIFGLAFNYKGSKLAKEYPVIFQKPVSSAIASGQTVFIPKGEKLDHESNFYIVELGFYVSGTAKNVKKSEWMNYIKGYCLILDMTSSSLMNFARENQISWDIGKGYDTFLPVSEFIPKKSVKDPHNLDLELTVNGKVVQKSNTSELIFKIPEILEYLTQIFTLNDGDLILTGTPLGVSQVFDGDLLHGKLEQKGKILATIQAKIESIK